MAQVRAAAPDASVAAYDLAIGKITAAEGQKVDAGKAGTYTVGKDGKVDYNKPIIFTKDNIAQYKF